MYLTEDFGYRSLVTHSMSWFKSLCQSPCSFSHKGRYLLGIWGKFYFIEFILRKRQRKKTKHSASCALVMSVELFSWKSVGNWVCYCVMCFREGFLFLLMFISWLLFSSRRALELRCLNNADERLQLWGVRCGLAGSAGGQWLSPLKSSLEPFSAPSLVT